MTVSKHPYKQYQHTLVNILKISNGDFYINRDANVKRLHHSIVNIPSVMRNVIKYDGKSLVSIDIKNSQPYLSLLLLNPDFWNKKSSKLKCEAKNSSKIIDLVNFSIITKYLSNNKHHSTYTMLVKTVKPLINSGFEEYIDSVTSGQFYEILNEHIAAKTGTKISSRKQLKAVMFLVLFSAYGYRGLNKNDTTFKRLFEHKYRQVSRVFNAIKKEGKELLPCLLQSIESYLILEVITKRISKEHPEAPLFTIHDSIATTIDYVEVVKNIMLEELTKAVGYAPQLHIEEWQLENMHKHLNELRDKANSLRSA
ncbi:hypothetical protein [Spongiimicrobium salis]|uniref:hypothetical protein n=1 Tax=Spongiimicrobium salis TaxID=1667022 RepID=UPI00374DBD92